MIQPDLVDLFPARMVEVLSSSAPDLDISKDPEVIRDKHTSSTRQLLHEHQDMGTGRKRRRWHRGTARSSV